MDESRRSLIKKAAVGAGLVWAAPVLTSMGATPAGAGTPAPTTTSSTTATTTMPTTTTTQCDCAQPAFTGKSVGCMSIDCNSYGCFGQVVEPCDSVGFECGPSINFPPLHCSGGLIADCLTRPGFVSGTVFSVVPGSLICDSLGVRVGEKYSFSYS